MAVETVVIRLGGREVIHLSDYSVKLGIFQQPGSFRCTIGRPYEFRRLAEAFPPKSTYEIFLNGLRIQTGLTDGFSNAAGGTKTEIQLTGRDPLQKLVDTELDKQLTFTELTYKQLVEEAFERSGLNAMAERFALDKVTLFSLNNEANRKAITGSKKASSLSRDDVEVVERDAGAADTRGSRKIREQIRAEVGEAWWDFVVRQLRRVGLFLWCGADGAAILASPNVAQSAIYRLIRTKDEANVIDHSFDHDTTGRHTECVVYGTSTGGKDGTGKLNGRFVDDEMVALLNPAEADRADGGKIKLIKTIRDKECKSAEQANNLARRQIAEERRAGWRLSYTIAGHTLPELGGDKRLGVMPDTVVDVLDDDLGIYGPMYVEDVTLNGRGSVTSTTIETLRIEDVFFLNEVAPKPVLKNTGVARVPPSRNVAIAGIGLYQSSTGEQDLSAVPPGFDPNGWQYPIKDTLRTGLFREPGDERPPTLSAATNAKIQKGRY